MARILLLVLALLPPLSAQTWKIRSGHPRIYVTPGDLSGLRSRCRGPFKNLYQSFRKGGAWILSRKAGTDWSDVTNLPYPAFLYLVTGESRYLEKTKEFFRAVAARPPHDTYLTPEWLRAGAVALDWTWTALSPAERKRFGTAWIGMAEWVLKNVWRHSDFNNHFVNEHLAVLYPGVLLRGEGIETARVKALLQTGSDYLLRHAVPAADEIAGVLSRRKWPKGPAFAPYLAEPSRPGSKTYFFAGGQAEGFSYNDWGYARPLALTCEMWRTATGMDLFKDSSFFRGQGVWHAYASRPDGKGLARDEDCPSGFRPGENMKTFMHLLAARLRDPLSEWVAEKVSWRFPQKAWKELLWRDPSLKARSPSSMGLPPAACFPKLGHVYFRSSWKDPESAFALFQCGPFYAGHQHLDNNTFVIHRTGSLAVDSGTNEYTSHRANYYCRTIAHNGVLVYDPSEKFGGSVWGPGGPPGSNDGGQARGRATTRAGAFHPGCPSDTGRILYFENTENAAYCVGDASRSYNAKKVKKALRAFLHLRPGTPDRGVEPYDTFLVYDLVEPLKSLHATWVIHSIERPRIEGDRFVIARDRGRLAGQVLLPKKAGLRLVGGKGKECWVDGKNYPPLHKKPDPEAGAWRIEFDFTSTALVVLHVLGEGGDPPPRLGMNRKGKNLVLRIRKGRLASEIEIPFPPGPAGLPRLRLRGKTGKSILLAPRLSQAP